MRMNHISGRYMKDLLHAFFRFLLFFLAVSSSLEIKRKRTLTFQTLALSPIAMRFAQIKVGLDESSQASRTPLPIYPC